MSDFTWIKSFAELTMTGVVAWLVWQTFSKTLPRMAKDFQEQLKSILIDFKDQLSEERKATNGIVSAVEKNSRLLVFLIAKIIGGKDGISPGLAETLGMSPRDPPCSACPDDACADCPENFQKKKGKDP